MAEQPPQARIAVDGMAVASSSAVNPAMIGQKGKPRVRIDANGQVYQAFGGDTASDWFGPGNPIQPVAPPDQAGRQFDYQVALNQNFTQRGSPAVTYAQLRNFAHVYDLARLMIEKRKGQIAKLEWAVHPRDQKTRRDARCDTIAQFLRRPDGRHFWQQWIKKLLEDMIVCDAAFVYPRYSIGGELLTLDTPDGTTFKMLIDEHGRAPEPPWPAYQQILKGVPATQYRADQLYYMPFNPTNDRLYGYGLIEQVIVTITMALNNQASQLQYFQEGSVPDMILSVPSTWTPSQIKEFKQWWDATLQGNLGARRGTMFVFDGTSAIDTKDAVIKTPLDEWIARIMCYCFGMSPAPFVATMNRATAEAAAEQAKEEGVGPTMDWVRAVMDHIIGVCFKAPDLCFQWQEEDETDPLTKAQTNDIKRRNGSKSLNECREEDGLDPIEGGDKPMLYSGTGWTLLDDVLNPPDPVVQPAGAFGATPPLGGAPAGSTEKAAGGAVSGDPFEKRAVRKLQPTKAAVATLTAEIHAVLQRQGKAIAAAIAQRLGKASTTDVESWLSDLDFNDFSALTAIIDSGLTAQGEDGFTDAVIEVGGDIQRMIDFDIPNTRAVQYASQRAGSLIGNDPAGGELAEATRLMIRGAIVDALNDADTVDELEATLADNYAFSESRAETIARTELKGAMSAGNVEGWRASGVVSHKVWQISNQHDIDDECNDNADAGEIGIDDLFPSGDDMPPAHPSCDCVVYPVVGDSNEG